jgi:hypothetical protein
MKSKSVILFIVILKFPGSIANFLIYAKAIYGALFTNSLFASFLPKTIILNADIALLEEAEVGFKSRPQTKTIEDRELALAKVKADLRSLRNEVQDIANADPRNALAIIAAALMFGQERAKRGKQRNTVKDGVLSGTVYLTAEGAGPHAWQMSLDDKLWTPMKPTRKSTNSVSGLPVGVVHYFQNYMILPNDEECEWSPSVSIMVR